MQWESFLGVRKFLPQNTTKTTTTTEETTSPARPVEEEEEKPSTKSKTTTSRAAFSWFPASAPVNGTLKGVVELGASGFNSFIINVDAKKTWKLEKSGVWLQLVYENMATDDDVRAGLKNYIGNMLAYGVAGKRHPLCGEFWCAQNAGNPKNLQGAQITQVFCQPRNC